MNPMPEEGEEYEAAMAEQAEYPGAGYGPPPVPAEVRQAPAAAYAARPLSAVEAAPASPGPMPMPLPVPQPFPQTVAPSITIETETRGHMLGVTTLASGLGMLLGVRLGGGYGAVAGSLFAGAAVNAFRAATFVKRGGPQAKREAAISGTYALLAAGLGGYVVYKFRPGMEPRAATPNQREDGPSCLTRNEARSCGIRAII